MKKFLAEKWPEILIIAFLFPSISTLFFFGWNLDNRIVRQEVRTDSIMAALPELRTRSAFETINKPFSSAIVVAKPHLEGATWYTTAHLIDAENGRFETFKGPITDQDDDNIAWSIVGGIRSLDGNAVSFQDMQESATAMRIPAFAPEYSQLENSFVIYRNAGELAEILKKVGLARQGQGLISKSNTWTGLTAAIKDQKFDPSSSN